MMPCGIPTPKLSCSLTLMLHNICAPCRTSRCKIERASTGPISMAAIVATAVVRRGGGQKPRTCSSESNYLHLDLDTITMEVSSCSNHLKLKDDRSGKGQLRLDGQNRRCKPACSTAKMVLCDSRTPDEQASESADDEERCAPASLHLPDVRQKDEPEGGSHAAATEQVCGICLGEMKCPATLPCNHSFCETCLDGW